MKFRDYTDYDVYEDGRIYSYKRKKFLKPNTRKDGYQQVWLTDNEGNRKMYLLHRFFYESVTGKPIPEGYEVNHISEDKNENSFESLNLLTHKDNVNFGTRNERSRKAISKAMTNNTKISKAVGAFKNGELVMVFPSTRQAQRQGFNQSSVSACCRNCYMREGNNVFKGYEWKYI